MENLILLQRFTAMSVIIKSRLKKIVDNQVIRTHDRHGAGHFGAPRGSRTHRGIDIVFTAGQNVYSPIDGVVTRRAFPYADDLRYSGVLITGNGIWTDFDAMMFYMTLTATVGTNIAAGSQVGIAQDLGTKYPGITNHIHFELRYNGMVVDPTHLF